MSESIYLIYKHTCIVTGKSYIGQTCDYGRRTKEHQKSNLDTPFSRAVQKYGWEAFVTEILAANLTSGDANLLEEQYVADHNTLSPEGYNLLPGGRNHTAAIETKLKMSAIIKQWWADRRASGAFIPLTRPPKPIKVQDPSQPHPHTGRVLSAETRAKMSASRKGRTMSAEQRAKLSIAAKNRAPHSPETRAKISTTRRKSQP